MDRNRNGSSHGGMRSRINGSLRAEKRNGKAQGERTRASEERSRAQGTSPSRRTSGTGYTGSSGSGGRRPSGRRRTSRSLLKNNRFRAMLAALIALIVVLFVVLIAAGAFDNSEEKARKAEAKARKATETVTKSADDEETAGDSETEETTAAETEEKQTEAAAIEAKNGRTVYLTFDDGPSEVTPKVLDKLDEYGVKATFFICYNNQAADVINDIVNRGHSIAVHSTTHNYDEIYASMEAFQNDVNTCRQFIYQTTGILTELYRFPGGSNNNVMKVPLEDCKAYLEEIGMRYYDWNINSSDASMEVISADTIAQNVLGQIHTYEFKTNVVLMHDSYLRTTGPDALDIIIPQLIEEGFGFDKLSGTTPEMTFDIE